MATTAYAQPARAGRPPVTIADEALRATQRRIAMITIWIPFVGTVIAVALAFRYGIGVVEASLLAVMYVLTNLGIEFGFHRTLAHRAFDTTPLVRNLFAALGSMAGEGGVLYWVATHRRHHIHSDTGDDPHSPHVRNIGADDEPMAKLRGLWHSHIGWMVNDKMTNCAFFASDINRDRGLQTINRLYIPLVLLGLAIPAAAGWILSGGWMGALNGFLWGGLVRMCLVQHSTWSNASFAHVWGGRVFDTGDRSANNVWAAIPTFGAAWQNNHHAFPGAAILGLEWWQVDVAGLVVRAFERIGLVWGVKRPTPDMIAAKRLASA